MAKPEEDIVRFGPFIKGVNNIDPANALAADELLNAVNLTVDRRGHLRRRPGYVQVIDEDNTHSLFVREDTTAFYASGTDFKRLSRASNGSLTATVLRSGVLQLRRPVCYVEVNGDVYYSNGALTGRVRADNSLAPWGIPGLSVTPTLSASSGALPAGRYLVALSFVTAEGEESGRTAYLPIELASAGGISVTGIQATADSVVTHVRVYLSSTNGDQLYRYADYAIGTTSATLTISATQGLKAHREQLTPFPATDMLEAYNGRIYGVSGRLVWYTEPLYYGLCNPRRNFLMFADSLVLMQAVTDGIYFGTADKTYFYAGAGPEDFVPRIVLQYGAIKSTGVALGEQNGGGLRAGWMSERGLVIGDSGGAVSTGENERALIGQFTSGASMVREQDGARQVVSTMKFETRAAAVSSDYAASEARRAVSI